MHYLVPIALIGKHWARHFGCVWQDGGRMSNTSYLLPSFTNHRWSFHYYILVQGFKVTGLFTGQYNTEDYGTFTGVIYSFDGGSFLSNNQFLHFAWWLYKVEVCCVFQPANACLRTYQNDEKSTFSIMPTRGSYKTQEEKWSKSFWSAIGSMFFIIFNHADACASMHLLVEIHNRGICWKIYSYNIFQSK